MLKMLLIPYTDTLQGWEKLIIKKKDKSLVLKMLHSLTATTGSAAGESKLDPTSLCFPKEGHVA